MPRSAEAKLRRRNRKQADQDGAMDMLGQVDDDNNNDTTGGDENSIKKNKDENEKPITMFPNADDQTDDNLPLQKKKKKTKSASSTGGTTSTTRAAPKSPSGGMGGIKTTPLILLVLMVGTTLLPALIYMGDYASTILSKSDVMGSIGYRFGIGSVPKKRVLSFYEKHAPEKLEEVPKILAKHYGDYPQLIKKLERKYQDYGYFIDWENDDAPMKLLREQAQDMYSLWIQKYWNVYAPQVLKTSARNARYNITFLVKRLRKIWKKNLWPYLEPIFGVPDGAAAQKRKDAAEAAKRRKSKQKQQPTRKKNRDYRDDVDED